MRASRHPADWEADAPPTQERSGMEMEMKMRIEELTAYEILEKKEIADLRSVGWLLRHKKSGARLALLENDEENKAFYIGFRTPPADSTGVAHILEHSVLEGSRDFPVKDPFIELVKGSLNTFLNAMTYPDKTVYPVASCNDQDFANLMHVYLDAVFYPNIYREPRIFYQEGWHYELQDPGDELTINGVVYNEMKGAFSSPDDVLEREILNSLFPDTPYAHESGGDPDVIPQLSYEDFLAFHKRYYHPSNSYIYLYGNMDMAERLTWLDEAYLSHFDRLEVDSSIAWQKPFAKPVEVRKSYPVTESEPLEGNTYLSLNTAVGDVLDREEYVAFQILDYALCMAEGAPLKQALLDAGIGQDVYSFYDNGTRQPYFSVVAKNTDESRKGDFLRIIRETLEELCREELDRKALYAGLNYYEFKYREADFGSAPAGLIYGLQVMDSWLYDDFAPFLYIEAGETFRTLREKVETGYFEALLEERLLRNPHQSVVVLIPERGLSEKKEAALAGKLAEYKASLSPEAVGEIVERTRQQEAFSQEPDRPENLAKIPLLARSDIRRKTEPVIYEKRMTGDTELIYHAIPTNGISYFRLLFDCGRVPDELFDYIGILKAVLGAVDTAHYTYRELFTEIDLLTGGLSPVTNIYTDAKDLSRQKITFELKGKAFHDRLKDAVRLSGEMLLTSDFSDEKRLWEILAEMKSHMQSTLISSGHTVASQRAMSYVSKAAALQERLNGMDLYRLVERLTADWETEKKTLGEKLSRLCRAVFRPENLMLDFIAAEEEQYELFRKEADALKAELFTEALPVSPVKVDLERKDEGYLSASQVQYVCRAGNFLNKGCAYTGALRILRSIMNNDYLWNNIRVRGGAYGCMCNFGKSGDSYFVSYRDPNLGKTIDVYEAAPAFVEQLSMDERAMTQAIIGTISDMDIPMNPAAKGLRALGVYLTNQTEEELQEERDQVLDAQPEDIRALAAHVRAFLADGCLCVVGNEKKIREEKERFLTLEQLYQN